MTNLYSADAICASVAVTVLLLVMANLHFHWVSLMCLLAWVVPGKTRLLKRVPAFIPDNGERSTCCSVLCRMFLLH